MTKSIVAIVLALIANGLIVWGISLISTSAAFIAAGIILLLGVYNLNRETK